MKYEDYEKKRLGISEYYIMTLYRRGPCYILQPCTDAAMCGGCKHCKLVIGRGELGLEPAAKLVLSLSGFIIITTLIHWIPRSPHKWHVLDPARKQSFQGFN